DSANGQTATCTQTITVNDTTAPTINTFPADTTVQCASAVPPADNSSVSATDNCGGTVTITHDADQITNQTCPNRYTITSTYHATDSCNNSSNRSQTITVNEANARASNTFPSHTTVSCASAAPTPNDSSVSATHNCN